MKDSNFVELLVNLDKRQNSTAVKRNKSTLKNKKVDIAKKVNKNQFNSQNRSVFQDSEVFRNSRKLVLSHSVLSNSTLSKRKSSSALASIVIVISSVLFLSQSLADEVKVISASNENHSIHENNKNNALAYKLLMGDGLERDLSKAAKLYKTEASHGSAEAQYRLGLLYLDGKGVSKDKNQALWWIEMSSEQRHSKARQLLNSLVEGDDDDC